MTCSYCETENHQKTEKCTFCNATLQADRPKQKPRNFLIVDHAEKPFEELVKYHTYDLLVLLRLVREERSSSYNHMITYKRLLQKAPESPVNNPKHKELVEFTESQYKRYTARMKVLEGILVDRMGYKPKRVDNKLLDALQAKIQRQ